MSQITAIIADTSSIGYVHQLPGLSGSTAFQAYKSRRNPQNAVARIRTVMNPHIVQEAPGGMISADFTIPAEDAQRWRPMLRYGAYCWLFDGHTPIFCGQLEQPTWTDTGDAQLNVSGPWVWLGKSRTREVWELRDMNLLYRGASTNEKRNASTQVRNDGSLLLSFADGAAVASGTYVSVEYYLYGQDGPPSFDTRGITGFEVDISDATFNGNANLVFRVQSIPNAAGGAGTTLWSTTATGSSNRQTADDVYSENNPAGAWASAPPGTRGLRFGIFATANITAGGGAYAVVDRIRITTRESLFPASNATQDTAAIARDLLAPRPTFSGFAGDERWNLPESFWPSDATTTNSDGAVKYGRDGTTGTGTAPNSGVGITGFNILEWTSPAEILLQLAGIDGSHVGFYLPYNQRGGYDAGNINDDATRSLWLSARPQLFYQPWPDPGTSPDYTIHIREGARVEEDAGDQKMLTLAYTDYQTNRGRQLSVIALDGNNNLGTANTQGYNYLANQGFDVADTWSVDSAANTDLASSLSANMLEVRRQPFAAARVTLTNDGNSKWPILKAGTQLPHLSMVRPGSVRLADVPGASGLRQGYATRVEWWGATLDEPEHVELTLSDPGQMIFERRLGWTGLRANRQRISGG